MKLIFAALFISLSMFAQAQIPPATKGTVYGPKINENSAIPVNMLEEKLAAAETYSGKVSGTVVGVCEKKGCWMKLKQDNGEGIMIRFKDYKLFMPKDIVGKQVVLEGEAEKSTTSVEMLKHYAEDAGKTKDEIAKINAPKTEIEFIATSVLVMD